MYYVGHGVESGNETHAVLKEGSRRCKYNLERMASLIGKQRLVHVVFDCNRLYMNNLLPQQVKVKTIDYSYIYAYSALAGRETKALNSVRTYIDHMRK